MKIGNIKITKSKKRDIVYLTNIDEEKVEVPRFAFEMALELVFINAQKAKD